MKRPSTNPGGQFAKIRVEGLGTESMSGQQREQAVAVLAALITAWQQGQGPDVAPPGPRRIGLPPVGRG